MSCIKSLNACFFGKIKFYVQVVAVIYVVDGKPVLNPERVFEHIAIILTDYSHILASEYAFLISNYFLTPSLWKYWSNADLYTLGSELFFNLEFVLLHNRIFFWICVTDEPLS